MASPSTPPRNASRATTARLPSSCGLYSGELTLAEKRFALRLAKEVSTVVDGVEVVGSAAVLHRTAGLVPPRAVGDVDCFVYLDRLGCQGMISPVLDESLLAECARAHTTGEMNQPTLHTDGTDPSSPGRVVAVDGKRIMEIVFIPQGRSSGDTTWSFETVDGVQGVPLATTSTLLHQYQHNADGRSEKDGWKLEALYQARIRELEARMPPAPLNLRVDDPSPRSSSGVNELADALRALGGTGHSDTDDDDAESDAMETMPHTKRRRSDCSVESEEGASAMVHAPMRAISRTLF